METIINGTKYKYQESVFGSKIFSYVNTGDSWINADEIKVDPITDKQTFIEKCKEIEALYN